MAINKSNPAWKLADKNINAIVKDIVENGTMGTEGERLYEQTAMAVLKETFMFNSMGRQLRGQGSRLNKLTYTTRRAWKEKAKKQWQKWGTHQMTSFLSENLKVNEFLETSFSFNKLDIKDAAVGGDNIKNILMNSLMVELPIEFEKRVLSGLRVSAKDGILLNDDNGSVKRAWPHKVEVNYSGLDDTLIMDTIQKMISISNKMGKQENPVIYRPGKEKFKWIINTELDAQIQRVNGYKSFTGDGAFQRALNNQPTKLLNEIPVQVSNELSEDQPFYLIPRDGAFGNIEFIFTTLPTNFFTRMDYEGTSATEMFYKIETDAFSINFSYWATKMGLWAAGQMGSKSMETPKYLDAHFVSNDILTGSVVVEYTVDASNTSFKNTDFTLTLIDQNFVELDLGPVVIDGNATQITLTGGSNGIDTGSYMFQIRGADGFAIMTSANYFVRNENYVEGETGSITTQSATENQTDVQSSTTSTPIVENITLTDQEVKVIKQNRNAKKQAKADAKALREEEALELSKQNILKAEEDAKAKAEAKILKAQEKEDKKNK